MKTLKEKVEAYGLNKVLAYMDSDYENNIPKVLDWLERFDKGGLYSGAYRAVREIIEDPDNNWNVYLKSIYTDLDEETRCMFMKNFLVNAAILGRKKQLDIAQKEDCNVPWAILMDPTSACNLRCTGCWAAEYGDKLNMSLETLNRIIEQGKDLGIYMYIYSGGEPLVRKKDIITLCEKHDECVFLAFTNGTLIDENFADEMKRVHNFVPAISIEGFEEATDSRRGKGTYNQVIKAMEILKERMLPFGISTCYTSKNVAEVGSDEYIDAMIKNGAKFCWYFTYMPIGNGAPTDLMATDEQREFMYHQVRRFRKEKPIFLLDFWNDGEYVEGCIAGGRNYLHINANGDVEPCAFIHYSNVNIKDVSLMEALKSPLFAEYRKGQPFNKNHLRPCPLLDNQGALAGMVKRSGAHSTDMASPEDVDLLTAKCKDAADRWEVTSEKIWINSPAGKKSIN
ncbi:radical SAM protein [Lutispora saccharofermentans]|uniref:Radical SAM protein n=1 Tax=Lutispora saccharofermentans TaxID=3024236 RepID=A0ABT1NJM4_9FIRM|nr:radical SAM protein [Lutispora saccharofermentans]MCQ1531470.1 radical SAM protein [Lutispora saccharofermentans]